MTYPREVVLRIRQWKRGKWPKRSTVSTDPQQSVEWLGAVGRTDPPVIGGDGMAPDDMYEARPTR